MRFADTPPLTLTEFESVLAEASRGTMITDLGINNATWNALAAVAEAAPAPRPDLLDTARRAFSAEVDSR